MIVAAAVLSGLSALASALWSRRQTRRVSAALRQDLSEQTNRALRKLQAQHELRFAPLEQHRQSDEAREADRRQRADALKAKIENMRRHDPRGAINVLQD